MVMKLKLGIMNNQALADWFGVKEQTFRKTKKRRLEQLKEFAKFHEEKGKVYIEEIYEPIYIKSKAKTIIEHEMDIEWNDSGLDSCSRVGEAIYQKHGDKMKIAKSTATKYTLETRKKLYGTPFKERGRLGSCTFVWCKKKGEGVDASYELLSAQEEEVKQTLLKKYFGNATEKQVIVQGMIKTGEITEEEAWKVLEELTNMNENFYSFLSELQAAIGAVVVRGTLVERDSDGVSFREEPCLEGDYKELVG